MAELLANSSVPGKREPIGTLASALKPGATTFTLTSTIPASTGLRAEGEARFVSALGEIVCFTCSAGTPTTYTITERHAENSVEVEHPVGTQLFVEPTVGSLVAALKPWPSYWNPAKFNFIEGSTGKPSTTLGEGFNTGFGFEALISITSSSMCTAVGARALWNEREGKDGAGFGTGFNTAVGCASLGTQQGTVSSAHNCALGAVSGEELKTGRENTFLGSFAGRHLQGASGVVAIGCGSCEFWAGTGELEQMVAVGTDTLQNIVAPSLHTTVVGHSGMKLLTTGEKNTGVGTNILLANTTGSYNTAVGFKAGNFIPVASGHTLMGHEAMGNVAKSSGESVALGFQVLWVCEGGKNVAVGYKTGFENVSGSGNVFIGFEAGAKETGSNKLYVANSSTTTPLILGDFSAKTLTIEASLTIPAKSVLLTGGTAGQALVRKGTNELEWKTIGGGVEWPYRYVSAEKILMQGSSVAGAGEGTASYGIEALLVAEAGATQNSAFGTLALSKNTSGRNNTALGYQAGLAVTIGKKYTALGWKAGAGSAVGGENITLVGAETDSLSSDVVVLGANNASVVIGGIVPSGTNNVLGSGKGVIAIANTTKAPSTTWEGAGGGQLYAAGGNLLWRSGAGEVSRFGLTTIFSTAVGAQPRLETTSNATKGSLLFGTSRYDEANNRLGIGVELNPPAATLEVKAPQPAAVAGPGTGALSNLTIEPTVGGNGTGETGEGGTGSPISLKTGVGGTGLSLAGNGGPCNIALGAGAANIKEAEGGVGGNGGPYSVAAGDGGAGVFAKCSGGEGAIIELRSGNGGEGGVGGNGGAAGNYRVEAGKGGTTSANEPGETVAGKGGTLTLLGGGGGAVSGTSTGSHQGGDGGGFSLASGTGGASSGGANPKAGAGGPLELRAGEGGLGSAPTSGTGASSGAGGLALLAGGIGGGGKLSGGLGGEAAVRGGKAGNGAVAGGSVVVKGGEGTTTTFEPEGEVTEKNATIKGLTGVISGSIQVGSKISGGKVKAGSTVTSIANIGTGEITISNIIEGAGTGTVKEKLKIETTGLGGSFEVKVYKGTTAKTMLRITPGVIQEAGTEAIGLYAATPVKQAAAVTKTTAKATSTTPWGFESKAQAEEIINKLNELIKAIAAAEGGIGITA